MRRLVLALGLLIAAAAPARAFVVCTAPNTRTVPGTDASITAALGNIPPVLAGPWCINITDSATYNEQVTVQGFTNNGSSITIQAMPAQTPTVQPPGFSTAAFHVLNSSVNIHGFRVRVNQNIPYGVWASSSYVQISSVSVSTFGALGIYEAGVRVSSWSAISYSSVTVWNAHGYWLDGSTGTTISFSSAANESSTRYPFYLERANNNSFTVLFASNSHPSGTGLYALGSDTNSVTWSNLWGAQRGAHLAPGSDFNTISLSTMIGSTDSGLYANASDSNTVTQSYISGGAFGAYLISGADFNTISFSTMIGNLNYGLSASGSDSNTVTRSYVRGGYGAVIGGGSDNNTISFSTVIGSGNHGMYVFSSDSNTVTQAYVQGNWSGLFLDSGADYNAISLSTMVGNNIYGLSALTSDSNTVTQSYMWGNQRGANLESFAKFNTISLSTMVGNNNEGLRVTASDTNTVTQSYIWGGQIGAYLEASSDFNTISLSTIISASADPSYHALYLTSSSSNTISQSLINRTGPGNPKAVRFELQSNGNAIISSTITAPGHTITIDRSSANAIVGSYIYTLDGTAVKLSSGGFHTISGSTLASSSASGGYTLHVVASASNTFSQSIFTRSGPGSPKAGYFEIMANGNSIVSSTFTSTGDAVTFDRTSSNTVVGSYLSGNSAAIVIGSTGTRIHSSKLNATFGTGYGARFMDGSSGMTLSASTITTVSGGSGFVSSSFNGGVIEVLNNFITGASCSVCLSTATAGSTVWIASNTIVPPLSGVGAQGVVLDGLLYGATVQNNNVYFRHNASGGQYRGMRFISSLGLVIERNRINQPGVVNTGGTFFGASFDNVRDSQFRFNDMHSSGTMGGVSYMLDVNNSTVSVRNNIFLSEMFGFGGTHINANAQSGLAFDYNSYYSSNGVFSLNWGGAHTFPWRTTAGIDAHSVTGNPLFTQTSGGQEDFHQKATNGRFNPATQLFVTDSVDSPSLDYGDPAEAFADEPAPNGGVVNPGSYGNTAEASKSPTLPCPVTRKVCKTGACPFVTIQSAVDNLPSPLPGHACVYIQDSDIYYERVLVEGIVNAGSSITIRLDPAQTVRPYVRANAGGLFAGFIIKNSSVNISNINVSPTLPVNYGIVASSANVSISNVHIEGTLGPISVAGIVLSSWSTVSYSSVNVGDAHGFRLDGATGTTVTFSTAINNSVSNYPVYLNGGKNNAFSVILASNSNAGGYALWATESDTNTVTQSFLWSQLRGAALNNGSDYNTISFSTMIGNDSFGLWTNDSDSNTITQSYMRGNASGARLDTGSDHNIISFSSVIASANYALYTGGADSNLVTRSYLWGSQYAAFIDSGSDYNTISLSTMTGNTNFAVYIVGSDSNTVTQSSMTSGDSGIYLHTGADYNVISLSTVSSGNYAVYALGADWNTVAQSYLQGAGYGAGLDTGSDNNSISLSTMIGVSQYGLYATSADSNTVAQSYMKGATYGVFLNSFSDYNVISLSTMIGLGTSGLYAVAADYNSVTQSYLWGATRGVELNTGSDYNSISMSTMIGTFGFYAVSSSYTAVTKSYMGGAQHGARFSQSDKNTISQSTITSTDSGFSALLIEGSSTNTIAFSYIQGSMGAVVSGATGTVINSSVLVATHTVGLALALNNGSVNLTVASTTLRGGPAGVGLQLNSGNGIVSIGSVTVTGSVRGMELSAQAANFVLAVDSITFRGLTAGATAIHFLGGTFVSTLTLANFEDSTIGANVSGAALNGASRISMFAHYGVRTGPSFENDPNQVVGWQAGPVPGCVVTNNVGGGQLYNTIQAGIDALPISLTGHSCVVVRDTQTYSGQVTVEGFTNNGSSITIMADPSFISSAPVVSPNGGPAGFVIKNASVNVRGFIVRPDAFVNYGVHSSSAYVTIDNVRVEHNSFINSVGVVLSSWNALSRSTVSVAGAHGVQLEGNFAAVSYSSITNNSGGSYALYINASDSNTVTQSFIANGTGHGVRLENGANGNSIGMSTMTSGGGGGLFVVGSESNSVTSSYMGSPAGIGAHFLGGSAYNTITLSVMASNGSSGRGLSIVSSTWNTVTQSFVSNPEGYGAYLSSAHWNTISQSTIAGALANGFVDAAAFILTTSSHNAISQSYIQGTFGHGLFTDNGSNDNLVSGSTITSGLTNFALYVRTSSSNTFTGSIMTAPTGVGALFGVSASYNTISQSSVTSEVSGGAALWVNSSDFNTFTGSYLANPVGYGALIASTADRNTISQSTMASASGSGVALQITNSDTNTVTGCLISNTGGTGASLSNGADNNVIELSTVTSRAATNSALAISLSYSNAIRDSYVQGSTAALVSDSTGTVIATSVLVATNTIGSALALNKGGGFGLSSSTLRGGPSGRGLSLGLDYSGVVSVGSVTVTGAARGLEISTQAVGFVLAVDSVTFRGLSAGATAIHYLGGTFNSTFTLANFEDATTGANVSAAALNPASRISMFAHYGLRTGPSFENDPGGLVHWEAGTQPGCVVTRNVGAGQPYGTISAGLAALPQSLAGHSCVVIRGGGTYVEQVIVSGFTNNGSSITIMGDPAVSTRPAVRLGFTVLNASVNIVGIDVVPQVLLSAGIFVSSPNVTISSVNIIDPGGNYSSAGIALSSWTTVSYTSVTVVNAYGFLLQGSTMSTVSYSSATNNSAGKPTVLLENARSNTILGLTAKNLTDGGGLRINYQGFNTISQSSFSSVGIGYGLMVYGSSFNTISNSRMFADNGHAIRLEYSYYNTVSNSTGASNGVSKAGLYLDTSSSNTISGVFASNPAGFGAYLTGSSSNTLSLSTFTSAAPTEYALVVQNGSSNTISGSYIANSNPVGVAAFLINTSSNILSQSVVIGGTVYGLKLNASVYNRIEGSNLLSGAELDTTSNNNIITGSTFTQNSASLWALSINSGSTNTVTQSFMSNPLGYALAIGASAGSYNAVSQSTITSNTGTGALYLRGVGNSLSSSYIANPGGRGANLVSASYSTISQSTIINNSSSEGALSLTLSATNTITQSVIFNSAGDGVFLDNNSNWNSFQNSMVKGGLRGIRAQSMSGLSVSLSTVTGGSAGASAGIWGDTYTNSITIANSYVQGSTGVYLSGSSRAVVTANVIAASGGGSGLFATNYSSTLTVAGNTILGGGAAGIGLDMGTGGLIRLSTNTIIARGAIYGIGAALLSADADIWIDSNTIVPTLSAAATTYGVYLELLPRGATVQNNGIYYRTAGAAFGGLGAGAYGLFAKQVTGLQVDNNRISNPSMATSGNYIGAAIDASANASFRFNDLYSTGGSLTSFNLLRITGSANVRAHNNILSSSMTATTNRLIVVDAPSQAGFASDYNTFFSSNSSYNGYWGASQVSLIANWIATTGQDAKTLSANPRFVNPAAEDFHPLSREGRWDGAGFVQDAVDSPVIDRADPAAVVGLEVQPNGARANQGSYGQSSEASQTVLPCPVTKYVRQAGGGDATTIQGGIAALSNPIVGGHSCVIIGDSGIYNEAVTVQNFTNNGSSITIMLDPSLTVHPTVRSGFIIRNASVNVIGIDVAPTGAIAYGIFASSANILLSSVNINGSGGGFVSAAGVALSSYSSLSYSIISVLSAHGLRLDGKFAVVSNSTMTNNSASNFLHALHLAGASSNTVTGGYISNPLGYGAVLESGADYNTISNSTITSGAINYVALSLTGSSRNTVTGSYMAAPAGHAATMSTGANYNTISFSTMVSNDSNQYAYYLVNADNNMVTGSLMQNLSGSAATMQTGSDNNTISLSTMIANAGGRYGLYVVSSDSNAVTGSYISNPLGIAAFIDSGADYNTISLSTVTSAAAGVAALDILGGRFNTVTGSYMGNRNGYGALFAGGANFNSISQSTMASFAGGNMALYVTASSTNTFAGNLFTNSAGPAVLFENGANYNAISQSVMLGDNSSARALSIFNADYNTVAGSRISNLSGESARLFGGADFNTISLSTITSGAAGYFALVIADSSSNTLRSSYVQGSTAAVVSNATGTVINSNVIVATNTKGGALIVRSGSVHLAMSSNTLVAGSQGVGLSLEDGNSGAIIVSTNTIYGGYYGLSIATQAAGTKVWITSNTIIPSISASAITYGIRLNGLASGATIQNNGIYWRTPGTNGGGFHTVALDALSSDGLVISGNRISNPGMVTGLALGVGLAGTPNTIFQYNDVHSTGTNISSAYHMRITGSPATRLSGNVFSSSWSVTSSTAALFIDAASQAGFFSDYNNFFSSNSFNSIEWGSGVSLPFPWFSAILRDGNSIAKHPRWKDPSTGVEDFHMLSQAGRWDGAGFVNDGFTSALIDKADPAGSFSSEASPNGGRANLGSYGNTAEASKTPAAPANSAVAAVFGSSVSYSYDPLGSDGFIVVASTASNFAGTQFSSSTPNTALTLLAPQGLAYNTTYYAVVGAIWGDYHAFAGMIATATLANIPGTFIPTLVGISSYGLTVNYTANGNPFGSTYTVVLSSGSNYPNSFLGNVQLSTTAFAAPLTGLSPNTTYFAYGAGINWNGMPSQYAALGSTPTQAAPPLTAISTFSNVGFSSFTVSWSANGNPLSITTYTVSLSTDSFSTISVEFTTAPAFGPSATFTGLGPNELYTFRVQAKNHLGIGSTFAILGSTLTRPVTLLAPAIAGFVAVDKTSITATWGLTALATGYTLVASLTNDPLAAFASSNPSGINTTTAALTAPPLVPNTTYFVFVRAVGPGAATAYSAYPATATLADAPAAAAIPFSGVELTSMTVSWLPGGNPVGVTTYTVVLSTGNAYPNSFFGNRALSTAPAGALPTATVPGLFDNTLYYLHVAGVNHGGITSSFTVLGSTVTRISPPSTVVFDEISSNTIVASAYAPTPYFSNLGVGQSGTQISRNGTFQPVHGEQWVSTTALVAPISEAGAAGFNSLVYVFGGVNGAVAQNAARVYDPATNVWSSLPNISSTRYGIGGAAAGGRIYAVGGTPDGGASLTVNEEYDPVANAWTTRAVLPVAADHLSAVGAGGAVYAFGGVNGGAEIDQTVQYDPSANAWTTRPVMPAARTQMAAAAAAGAMAGRIAAAGGNGPTNAVNTYNTITNAWSGASFLPAAVEQGAAASLGGKIFVIGGALSSQAVYEYDPAVDTWTVRAIMPTGRAGLSAVAAGGHIYAMGGSADGGATSLTVNEAYDPGVATRFSGLAPNTLVNFRARARGQAGTLSGQTAIVSTYTWAALPIAVAPAFTVVAADSVTFNWALNGNPGGTEFKARASTSSSFGGGAAVLSSDWAAMTSTATLALTANTTYFFQSSARNGIAGVPGIQTAWVALGSTATLAAVPAAAPTPFPAAATNGLTVSWLANGNPLSVTTYTVVVSTDAVYPNVHAGNFTIASTQPAGALPTATLTGLAANTTYFAFAAARNWNGLYTAYAALGSTSTLALPPAAAAPTFAAVHESSATFSWLPNGNPVGVTTYSVVLSTGGAFNSFAGNFVLSTTPAGALPTATAFAGSLIPNTTYFGYAAASNSNGAVSAYTPLGSTATLAALPATAVTTFTAVEIGSITVSWSANGNPLATSSYTVQLSTDSFATIAVSFTTAPAAGPSATFTGLDDYKDYFFRVRAVNHGGSFTGFVSLGSTRTLLAPLAVPPAAGFPSVDITSITATWGLVPSATGYTLIASTVAANPPTSIAASSSTFAIAATTAAALLPALDSNTTYFLFVRANGNLRSSLFTAYGATSTLAAPPATVASTFTGVGITSFTVSWSANGNALAITTYTVQLSTAPDFNAFATSVTFTTAPVFGPNAMFTGLSGNTSYYFRVRALNHNGVPSAYVNLGSTLTVASPLFPTILNSQTGDALWRRANTALYSTAFLDTSGAHLDKFQVKASTTALGLGTDVVPFTDVIIGLLPSDSYSTPWSLPVPVFDALIEGVTNYITVKVFNGPPLNNFTVLQDAFYVKKDTTSPIIVNTQSGDAVPRSVAGTTYTVGVRDPSSGLAAFQYSASLSPVAANAEVVTWTDIAAVAGTTSYTTPWPVDFTSLVSGVTNYISVRSWDVAGATTTAVAAFYVHKDTTGPSVAIVTPQSGSFTSSLGQLSGTAASIYGVQGTEVSILDMTLNLYWNPAGPAFNSALPILMPASGATAWTLAPGILWTDGRTYRAVARSSSTANIYSTIYATSTFVMDLSTPTVGVLAPVPNSTVAVLPQISGTAVDPAPNPSGLSSVEVRLRRNADGLWWNWFTQAWGVTAVSSVTTGTTAWSVTPTPELKALLDDGASYFIAVRAADNALPANAGDFFVSGATFTWQDVTPPSAVADLAASHGSAPGRIDLTWTAPGDDAGVGPVALGEYRIFYSTDIAAVASTAAAQVVVTTAGVYPGTVQAYTVIALNPGTTYYLRLALEDGDGNWSNFSNQATTTAAPSPLNAITGHVLDISTQGITAVQVDCWNAADALMGTTFTLADGSGTYTVNGLPPGNYKLRVTWTVNGFSSSLWQDGIAMGSTNVDFFLNINYALATLTGTLSTMGTASFGAGGLGVAAAESFVELHQQGRMVARATPGPGGSWTIGGLLPGTYSVRAHTGLGYTDFQDVVLAEGEVRVLGFVFDPLPESSVFNFPNPARTSTTIRFETALMPLEAGIYIFDLAGNLVKEFSDSQISRAAAPVYRAVWDLNNLSGRSVAPGVYNVMVKIKGGSDNQSAKVIKKLAVVR